MYVYFCEVQKLFLFHPLMENDFAFRKYSLKQKESSYQRNLS